MGREDKPVDVIVEIEEEAILLIAEIAERTAERGEIEMPAEIDSNHL
jgi:hypothetical protein